MKTFAFLMTISCLVCTQGQTAGPLAKSIHIPRGVPVEINGHMEPKEWDDGASVAIDVGNGWKSNVRVKHDNEFIYFLFTGLKRGGERLFPEILIDPMNRKRESMGEGAVVVSRFRKSM